jgi:hypothetical protein
LSLLQDKEQSFYAKELEDQIKLLVAQEELEKELRQKYVDLSVSQTIYKLVIDGQISKAAKIKSDFKVPDERFWWLKIRALGETKNWTELDKFVKSKKSPIGYTVRKKKKKKERN